MYNKQKFETFLEKIKDKDKEQNTLIESIKTGFKACFENEIEMNDILVISDAKLKNIVYKITEKYTKSIYSDNSWVPVHQIIKEINTTVPILNLIEAYYDNNQPPKYKKWKFEGKFKDPNGKNRKAYATITASGAGSVQDPLDKYDVTVVFSTGSDNK